MEAMGNSHSAVTRILPYTDSPHMVAESVDVQQ